MQAWCLLQIPSKLAYKRMIVKGASAVTKMKFKFAPSLTHQVNCSTISPLTHPPNSLWKVALC